MTPWPVVNWAKVPVLTLGMEPSKLQRLQEGNPIGAITSRKVWGFEHVGHPVGIETILDGDPKKCHNVKWLVHTTWTWQILQNCQRRLRCYRLLPSLWMFVIIICFGMSLWETVPASDTCRVRGFTWEGEAMAGMWLANKGKFDPPLDRPVGWTTPIGCVFFFCCTFCRWQPKAQQQEEQIWSVMECLHFAL